VFTRLRGVQSVQSAFGTASAAAGGRITPGSPYYPAEAVGAHLRLSYAANTPASIASAIERIAHHLDR
jgi:DNA-binding transcriptional MocR family regulator